MLSVAAKTAAVPAASEAARSSSSSSHSRRRVFTNSVTRNRSGAAYSMSTDAVQPALVVELPELPERETSRLVGPQPTAADDYDAGAPNLRPQARRCRPWAVCTFAVVGGAVLAAIATALLSPYLPRRDDVPGLLDVAAARVGVITVRMPAADVETDAYSCSAFEWQDTVVSITASLPAPSDVRGVHHMSLFRCGALASGVELGQRFPCDDIEGLCRSEPQMLFGFEHMDGGGGGASSAAPPSSTATTGGAAGSSCPASAGAAGAAASSDMIDRLFQRRSLATCFELFARSVAAVVALGLRRRSTERMQTR